MQESRLFKIVYYLLEHEKSTASELAEKFEVSVRTIYRDIDALSSAGIPICATQGKGGGIYLLDNFVLDRSVFSDNEKEQILTALKGISAADGNNLDELLTKLRALFEIKESSWIEVDFTSWYKKKPKQDIFRLLKDAIFSKNVVKFKYFNRNREILERKVQPIQLVFKDKYWYLYGFCLLKNDYRFFKLTRMTELKVLTESFCRDFSELEIGKTIKYSENISVKLKFNKSIAFQVYDEFYDEVIECDDGSLYVEAELPNNDILYTELLSFGDDVEVLEPESVREKIRKKLENMFKKYL